ncbi:DNA-binding protein [Duganella hordei]|uniref:DNA-binding protein n=1 Tax=Duganella hordei TaxID=2865934 RepID=UPI0030EA8834
MESHADIAPDIVRRINEAADQLYEEAGRSSFPNVDAVRRRARANMNHASLVMRDWRHRRIAPTAVPEDALPDSLEPAARQLLNAFWREASALANGHLQTAQAGWDQERRELEEFRDQLAAAFDTQAGELAEAYQTNAALRNEISAQQEQLAELAQRAGEEVARAGNADAALAHAKTQLQELHESLRQAQHTQQQLALRLQEQHAAATAAAERNLSEQTRYAEQLGQARQEAAGLHAQLAALTNPRRDRTAATADGKRSTNPGKATPP